MPIKNDNVYLKINPSTFWEIITCISELMVETDTVAGWEKISDSLVDIQFLLMKIHYTKVENSSKFHFKIDKELCEEFIRGFKKGFEIAKS